MGGIGIMGVINALNVIGSMLGEKNHALAIEHIGYSFFSIRCLELEPVSGTHELSVPLFQLPFESTPVVAGLRIVRLIIDDPHHTIAKTTSNKHPKPTHLGGRVHIAFLKCFNYKKIIWWFQYVLFCFFVNLCG